jgi:RNA polymerase sigma-70 factor (ECF subfamily)
MIDPQARRSVEQLLERLRPFVARRLASSADVDDVLQDVLLRAHGHLGELRDETRFGPWLYRIVRNSIVDHHRLAAREARQLAADPNEADDDEVSSGLTACIAPFVARLPSPYREAVTLIDLEGMAIKQAAAMMGLTVPGMKSRVQRGRMRLRALFEKCCRVDFDARRKVIDYTRRPGKGLPCACGS